jgi:hypothetical protein
VGTISPIQVVASSHNPPWEVVVMVFAWRNEFPHIRIMVKRTVIFR